MTRPLLVAAMVALVATGCGAAENEPNLAAAIEKTEAAGSSRIAIDGVEIDSNGRAEIECRGQADYERERLEISCDYGGDGTELIAIGRQTYFRGDVFGTANSASKWTKVEDDESLGNEFSPQALLAMLHDASRSTERIGEEQVRGDDALRYRLVVECEQVELTDCDAATAPVDVWVGEDGLVRRIAVEHGSSPFTVEFYDFGVAVDIEPPSPGDVQSIDGLFGSVTCAAAFGTPIALEHAMKAMRRHGFSIIETPECSTASASFQNDSSTRAEHGHLYCVVRGQSPKGAPSRAQRLGEGVAHRAFRLENLECSLASGAAAVEAKLARVDAALSELER